MAYTALYRKFRPLTFNDMVGQEHITKTLKNQIMADRVGHSYLFNGGRGTGKTSSAKILARAVNCLHPKEGEPCNECEICKGILAGTLTDVVEMDAASNNSVEDIRQIRDEVNFLPSIAKYRVYIIDEVHMLSTGAFNSLLKTLEEPPKHVKFFLATTEPQKLPATILSRCQRFDFKRIPESDIVTRLEIVCKEDNIKVSKEAVHMVAVLAEGGMRDALSILERCIQEEDGEEISEDIVRELAGIPKITYINRIVGSIISNNVEELLLAVKEVIDDGKDLDNFLWEVIKYVKDILVYKATGSIELYNEKEKQGIANLSNEVTKERLLNLIYTLSELANGIKWSTQKTIMLQAGLIKCGMAQDVSVSAPEQTIQRLKTENNVGVGVPGNPQKDMRDNRYVGNETPSIPKRSIESNSGEGYVSYWSKILELLKTNGKIMLYTNLLGTKAKKTNDICVEIEFPGRITAFAKTVLDQYENKEELSRMVSMEEGQKMQIKYSESAVGAGAHEGAKGKSNFPEDIGIKINIIDE